jgi:hypothetical protein
VLEHFTEFLTHVAIKELRISVVEGEGCIWCTFVEDEVAEHSKPDVCKGVGGHVIRPGIPAVAPKARRELSRIEGCPNRKCNNTRQRSFPRRQRRFLPVILSADSHNPSNSPISSQTPIIMGSRLHNAPIVIDNGSGTIRAGFAGEDVPKCYFPSYVGRPKHVRTMAGALEGDVFIGPQAQQYRGLFKINYPLEHGIVTDWDDMERIWQYVYQEGLKTVSEDVSLPMNW